MASTITPRFSGPVPSPWLVELLNTTPVEDRPHRLADWLHAVCAAMDSLTQFKWRLPPCPGCWVKGERGYEPLVPLNRRHQKSCLRNGEI